MTIKTNHQISVNCEPEAAFSVGLDVSQWPRIFPPCLAGTILNESEEEQEIAITAWANGKIFSWQSVRQVNRNAKTISFHQSQTSPLVKSMSGQWSFDPSEEGCLIRLTHEFEIADDITNRVPGVETKDDAATFMMESIETNSVKELASIARHLDAKVWTHKFEEKLVINAPESFVSDLLWTAQEWPSLLQHCTGMEVLYDDGINQEFMMTVEVGDTVEKIRSIRNRSPRAITYFQPTPPDPLLEHRGRWTWNDSGSGPGIEIVSYHEVLLSPVFWRSQNKDVNDAKCVVEDSINRNSLGTMKAIQQSLRNVKNA